MRSARRSAVIRGVLTGVSTIISMSILFSVYGVGLWFGVWQIMEDVQSDRFRDCVLQAATDNSSSIYKIYETCQNPTSGDIMTVIGNTK